MNKKYRIIISIFLFVVLAVTFTLGGLKMQKAYGNTYLSPEDEIFKNVTIYSVSDTHSLFVAESEGQQKLYVKGYNTYGQLGTKDYNDYISLTQILIGLPESKIVKVWALTNASFIQTEDGKLYAAGNNNQGKLGVASDENTINEFTEVILPPEAVGHIVDVQGNGNFTIFKTDIGKFYGSGDNTYGQLGLSDLITKVKDINGSPVVEIANGLVDGEGNPVVVKDMAAGKDFSVLIDNSQDGNIYFAGNNSGSFSNGLKQSATDFLPDIVYEFTFVTNVSQYDKCYYHTSGLSPNNYYIIASDETYAVIKGMVVTEEFKGLSFLLSNYAVGSEVFPEVFLFSSVFEDVDFSTFPVPYEGLDVFNSATFADILGSSNGVHGVKYADWILVDNGDFQVPQSKSDFRLLNEGLLFWFKSLHSNILYMSYFGKNNVLSPNYIPWLQNTGLLYTEEHIVSVEGGNTSIENVSASQKMLLFSATNGSTDAIYAAGDNTNGMINPLIASNYIDISMFNVMSLKLNEVQYPFYIANISPSPNNFTMEVGEQKTVSFNSINRPKLSVSAVSNTTGKSVSDIITYNVITDSNGIVKGIDVTANGGGSVTVEVFDDGKELTKLFEMTFDVTVPTSYNMSFEDGLNTVTIGETLDVVFLAPAQYAYGADFELRTSKPDVYVFSTPVLLGTSEDNISRYYTTITPVSPTADSADLEIWVLGADTQCVASKTINVIEPQIEKIEIDFAPNMPTSINVGDTIDITQYVIPAAEATNMSYTVLNGGDAFLRKIEPSVGTFQGMAEAVVTIRINHPHAITHKDFNLMIKAIDDVPSEEKFTINSSITSINLEVGKTATIFYSTTPSGKESQVTVSSDNPLVCTINTQTNTVTAVGVGSTYIRLSSPNAIAPLLIPVTVTSNITLSAPQSITVIKGQTVQIPVSISPESERENLFFTTNNLNVGVSQNGHVTGINVGTAIVSITHPASNTTKNVVVTVINSNNGNGNDDDDDNKPNNPVPRIVLGNTLNKKGELEVVLGGKIELNATVENYTGNVTFKYVSGDSSKASIKDATLSGVGLGKTTLVISTNVGITPLQVTVNVIRASYADEEININLDEIKTEEQQQQENQVKANIILKQNQQYKINVVGAVTGVDLDNYFDEYFVVKTTEKYVSYLGNGVIRANYPGETTVYLYQSDGKKLAGKVKVTIPYPDNFFNKMPNATGIPFNRTIRITFNQNILSSSVTEKSVFVQEKDDGNGKNLERVVSVSNNILNILIPLPEDESSKTKTVYIYILPEVKSTSYTPLYSPIVIPVTFVK